jgi:hypothetical protein
VDVYIHIFSTSALLGGGQSASRPGRFTTGVTPPRYPLDRRLGGPQSRYELRGPNRDSNSDLVPTALPSSLVKVQIAQ